MFSLLVPLRTSTKLAKSQYFRISFINLNNARVYSARTSKTGMGRRPTPVKRNPTNPTSPLSEATSAVTARTPPSTAAPGAAVNPLESDSVPYHIAGANYSQAVTLGLEKSTSVLLEWSSPASAIFKNTALLVCRQLELLNLVLGWEQAAHYDLKNPNGQTVGYLLEDKGMLTSLQRQFLHNRAPFKALVTDLQGNQVLKINRPFQMWLNSTIKVERGDGVEIGRVVSDWHLFRRRYDLYVGGEKRMRIDEPMLSWDFTASDPLANNKNDDDLSLKKRNLGLINRNWSGFLTEIFTDKGQYVVHYDATPNQARPISLEERAVLLACAITVDIDYFSQHSSHNLGIGPVIGGGDGVDGDRVDEDLPSNPVPGSAPSPPLPSPDGGGLGGGRGDLGGLGGSGTFPSTSEAKTPPPSPQGQKNEWGDDAFLTDEEAGISSQEAGDSSFLKDAWGILDDDDDYDDD